MGNAGRKITVKFSEEAFEEYEALSRKVAEERGKGSTKSDNEQLYRAINKKKELLQFDPEAGEQIPRRLIPSKYIIEYDVNNLWWLSLCRGWRMIYTLHGNEVELITFVLDIFDHESYEKVFRYKKR